MWGTYATEIEDLLHVFHQDIDVRIDALVDGLLEGVQMRRVPRVCVCLDSDVAVGLGHRCQATARPPHGVPTTGPFVRGGWRVGSSGAPGVALRVGRSRHHSDSVGAQRVPWASLARAGRVARARRPGQLEAAVSDSRNNLHLSQQPLSGGQAAGRVCLSPPLSVPVRFQGHCCLSDPGTACARRSCARSS